MSYFYLDHAGLGSSSDQILHGAIIAVEAVEARQMVDVPPGRPGMARPESRDPVGAVEGAQVVAARSGARGLPAVLESTPKLPSEFACVGEIARD